MIKVQIVRLQDATNMPPSAAAVALENLLNDGYELVDITAAHGGGESYYVAPVYYLLVKNDVMADKGLGKPRFQQLSSEKWK